MFPRKKNVSIFKALIIGLLTIQSGCQQDDSPEPTQTFSSLSEFVSANPTRKLHGWGQGISRWESEAIPYFEAMQNKPVVIISYLTLSDITINADRLDQFDRISNGWTDPNNGTQYPYIPFIGLTVSFADFHVRRELYEDAFFEEMGITPALMSEYNIGSPTYELSVFALLAGNDDLWIEVQQNLVAKGYEVADLDIKALLQSGSEESQHVIFSLRDQIMENAAKSLVNQGYLFEDLEVIKGVFDQEITQLAGLIKKVDGPVLLRIFFETYGGLSRPFLSGRTAFKDAYKHIVDLLKLNGANNVEYVWHPLLSHPTLLEEWYPGDNYVDWIGTSYYAGDLEQTTFWMNENNFAVKHNKPYLIAESAPSAGDYRPNNTSQPMIWERWFEPYFAFIRNTPNLKMFVYININWGASEGPFSDWGDTRVQSNQEVLNKYNQELQNEVYLHNDEFWQRYSQQ